MSTPCLPTMVQSSLLAVTTRDMDCRGVAEFLSGKPQPYYFDLLAAYSREDGAVTAAIAQGTVRHRAEQEQSDNNADDGGHAVALSDVPMAPLAQARPLESIAVARKKAKRGRAAGEPRGTCDDGRM